MTATVADLTTDDLRRIIRETVHEAIEEYLEDLVALESEEYLRSIEEAREDRKAGRVVRLADLPGG